jgi:site-specific recombinase XerC
MKKLNFELKNLCDRNRDGSYATREKRFRALQQCADQLHEMGYKKMGKSSLKPKHVEALVERWKQEELTPGSIKNRMAVLRWWAEKAGKVSVIARNNDHYGIDQRKFVTGKDKSCQLDTERLEKIIDPHIRLSLKLQEVFGLRREEAIKFQPEFAMKPVDRGYIQLKSSWTKGGKARFIPLSEQHQQQQITVLNEAAALAGKGSMIPSDRQYIDQLRIYERQTSRAGFSKLHGLRHHYAQTRYRDITGWDCPAKGGPLPREMPVAQRQVDYHARLQISRVLGHERKQIVAIYLGG